MRVFMNWAMKTPIAMERSCTQRHRDTESQRQADRETERHADAETRRHTPNTTPPLPTECSCVKTGGRR